MYSRLWAFVICYRVNFIFTLVGVKAVVQGRNGWIKVKNGRGNRGGGAQLTSFSTDSPCNALLASQSDIGSAATPWFSSHSVGTAVFSLAVHSCTPKLEAATFSETSVNFYQTTPRLRPCQLLCCKALVSHFRKQGNLRSHYIKNRTTRIVLENAFRKTQKEMRSDINVRIRIVSSEI